MRTRRGFSTGWIARSLFIFLSPRRQHVQVSLVRHRCNLAVPTIISGRLFHFQEMDGDVLAAIPTPLSEEDPTDVS